KPRPGEKITFTDQSTGEPETWSWDFGDGGGPIPSTTSTAQNPTFPGYPQEGTYTVRLTVSNCKNTTSSTITKQITVENACSETAKPTVDFTWTPTGPLPGVPQQQQPYVGQEVTLTASGTNHPTEWLWEDFQELHQTFQTQTVKVTWTQAGNKNVRLKAKNCVGWSDQLLKVVTVYPDVRPVVAEFNYSPANPSTGQPVVFTAVSDTAHGNPSEFSWRFGDDQSTATGQSVSHTFTCRGTYQVALIARRGSIENSTTRSVTVTGEACGPEAIVAADAAQVAGLNNTSWRTDLRIFNPSEQTTRIFLAVLPAGQNNATPFQVGPYTIPPRGTTVLNNILQMFELLLGKAYSKAALRITFENEEGMPPVVIGRTYTNIAGGGTMGQFVPGRPVVPNSTPPILWIAGGRNNGTSEGFRTNFGIANLKGDRSGVNNIELTLFDATGAAVGSKSLSLAPYGYLQDAVKNVFGSAAFGEIGPFAIKVGVPEGADIEPYISVVDNKTGDNVLIPGRGVGEGVLYLPAVAHNRGEAGTVWRTSVQMTNPDDAPHTWEVKFFPKGDVPDAFRTITLAPHQTVFTDDVVGWMYQSMEAPEVSGTVRLAPVDGSNVAPVAVGRTYNLTSQGTFGQDIPALSPADGIKKGGEHERMVITGMSSADISRSNLGFVALSETSGVDFAIYFYDENGTLLNPEGKPYTGGTGPNGWDQDKLENRFRNFFKQELPANQRVVSAVIQVRSGGPGFAYASVIDNLTGDPIFVPAYILP
ncbi:MAG: PKD domain-containing protein, partial [Thermoanaerobaculaceae bacterium]|nr:PKD domain-containing protein [Thermoanaerobaculaceae bacterium]